MSNNIEVLIRGKKLLVNEKILRLAMRRVEMAARNKVAHEVANEGRLARKEARLVQRQADLNRLV